MMASKFEQLSSRCCIFVDSPWPKKCAKASIVRGLFMKWMTQICNYLYMPIIIIPLDQSKCQYSIMTTYNPYKFFEGRMKKKLDN